MIASTSSVLIIQLILALALRRAGASSAVVPSIPSLDEPKLTGQHFRITAFAYPGYVDIKEDPNSGTLTYGGYLIDILRELSKPDRADFTYELRTPSGYGSLCDNRLDYDGWTDGNQAVNDTVFTLLDHHHPDAYHKRYRGSPLCGESDVNDRPLSAYSTDMYWGIYYITPKRLQVSQFTLPLSPPDRATLGMMGTATHIHSIHDLALPRNANKYAVCSFGGTAFFQNLVLTFPMLDIKAVSLKDDYYALLNDGTCDILIGSFPILKQRVLKLYLDNKCKANGGKPIGIIGDPLEYGLNSFAFGIRDDLPIKVVKTLNFWLQALMACYPHDPTGYCPNGEGSLSEMYNLHGGTGEECGYVQFPPTESSDSLPVWAIVAIALTPVLLVVVLGMCWHIRQLKKQEKKLKKRFIQQLSRNIEISKSPHNISASKLSEQFQHIGGEDGLISKDDLAKWMNDLHLDFLSEAEFDQLWESMDTRGTGYVDPIAFSAFLSQCEEQFEEVHKEQRALPRSERVKIAALRLSNIKEMGEEEVLKMERRMNKRSRFAPTAGSTPMKRGSAISTDFSSGFSSQFSSL